MGLAAEFSTITEMFDNVTRTFAGTQRPALKHKKGEKYVGVSYTALRRNVETLARGLSVLGVKRGDHIALISENRPEWIISDMAMLSLGAVNVPLYTILTPKQIEFILEDAKVSFVIVSNQLQLNKVTAVSRGVKSLKKIIVMNEQEDSETEGVLTYAKLMNLGIKAGAEHREAVERERERIGPDDLLTIIYTSGTTGTPKGVMLTHKNLVSNIHASAACIPISADSVFLSFLPFCHSFERMAGYYTAMSCGATIAFAESIETVPQNFLEIRPTCVTAVPRFFERMHTRLQKQVASQPVFQRRIFEWAVGIGKEYVQARKQNSSSWMLGLKRELAELLVFRKIKHRLGGRIEYFFSGGAALSRELGEFFEALGILVIEGYGLTESSPVISVNRIDNYRYGTVGHPIPGVDVKIAADGEILARGPNVMKGYWNNPQATAEAIDDGGWLHTGDIGRFDVDGFLVITDRKKHLFVSSGGKNIAPQPIESLFLQSEYIDQIVLIGDMRMFCSALVVPHFDAIREYAARHNIPRSSNEELVRSVEIYRLFQEEINRFQKDLAQFERVRKFTLLSQPLTIDNGEVTPTLKIRRGVVEEKFRQQIEKMYELVT